MTEFKNHDLVPNVTETGVLFEKKPVLNFDGKPAEGLYTAWITLNNPKQYNSYTTSAVKEVILAFRQASHDRSVVSAIFTAVGDKAFCTGGNTKEYAEYYSGNPQEYKQYMRLFNDMVTTIMTCDKPVINRVNGMRLAGGQEIGMACDFTISADTARYGQAGPKHGSAPVGGSTDFLHLFVGIERALASCTLCEMWTAYESKSYGLISEVVPVLKIDGKFIRNPLVVTDKYLDDTGLADNTVIIFASDNGPESALLPWAPTSRGRTPFKGHKHVLYEGGIRVPGIVRWPGLTQPGSECNIAVSTLDLFPTLCKAANAPLPNNPQQPLDGGDLRDAIKGKQVNRRQPLYWQYEFAPSHYVIASGVSKALAMRDGCWKLMSDRSFENFELYNLDIDPAEHWNLVRQHPDIAQRLKVKLKKIFDEVNGPYQQKAKYMNPNIPNRTVLQHADD